MTTPERSLTTQTDSERSPSRYLAQSGQVYPPVALPGVAKWLSNCFRHMSHVTRCDVRYRRQDEQAGTEPELSSRSLKGADDDKPSTDMRSVWGLVLPQNPQVSVLNIV